MKNIEILEKELIEKKSTLKDTEKKVNQIEKELEAFNRDLGTLEEKKSQPRELHAEGENIEKEISNLKALIQENEQKHSELLNEIKQLKEEEQDLQERIETEKIIEEEVRKQQEANEEEKRQRKSSASDEHHRTRSPNQPDLSELIEMRNKSYKYISSELCEYLDSRTGEIIELRPGVELHHWSFGKVEVSAFEERDVNVMNKGGGADKIIVGKIDRLVPKQSKNEPEKPIWGTGKVKLAFLFLDPNDELLAEQKRTYMRGRER